MQTENTLYYRDEVNMGREKWLYWLSQDIDKIQKKNPSCPISDAVMGDIARGLTSIVNQHVYKQVQIKSVKVVLP